MEKRAIYIVSLLTRSPGRLLCGLLCCLLVAQVFGNQLVQQSVRQDLPAINKQQISEQEQSLQIVRAPVVVVSATRTGKLQEEAPVPVEVISDIQIQKQNAKDLSEALKQAQGILVQPIHGKTGDAIKIQGIDSERILILVDGERVTASTGSTVDLSQIAVSDVEQIEIVKGASSALYGSSAMGGVVNVITKKPKPGWQGSLVTSLKDYGDIGYAGVMVDQYDIAADLSYQAERYWGFASVSSRNSEGFEILNQGARLIGPDGYKNNYSIGVGGKPTDNTSVEISQRLYREDHVLFDYYTIPGQEALDRLEEVQTDRTRLKVNWDVNESYDLSLQGFVEEFYNNRGDAKFREADINTYNFDLQTNWDLNENNILTAGVNTNGESLTQYVDGVSELEPSECGFDFKCERDADEIYLQLDHFLNQNIEIIPGFRYQNDSDFGSHFAPKVSVMYSIDNEGLRKNFRASVGNGYRVPNLKERYFLFDHSHLGYMVLGNPDLEPEEIISYQLGVDIQPKSSWSLGFHLFYNDMDQFIQEAHSHTETGGAIPVTVYEYQNITESRTYGFEFNALYEFKTIALRGNYQNLKSEDKFTKLDLAQNPEHLLKLSLDKTLLNNRASLLLQMQYQSESFINAENTIESPAFSVWDLKFDYGWNESLRYFAGIDNIHDEHRDPAKVRAGGDLRPVPGREIYLGAQFIF